MVNVLVTDGNQRAALAIVRSLGSRGIRVVAADTMQDTLGAASCFSSCAETYVDLHDLPGFISSMRDIVARHDIGIIIPVTEATLFTLVQHRDQFPDCIIPFESYEKLSALSDKANLISICEEIGVPYPKSCQFENGLAALSVETDIRYPLVLKPQRSKVLDGGRWLSTSVKYANSRAEFERLCREEISFSGHPFILQEYFQGHGQGIFFLCDHGKPVAKFAHRRLREKPPTGGVSVFSESVPLPRELTKYSEELLRKVAWHGVAMVEFKVNDSGDAAIMEVNTRFWGSLQLAIDAGVDFPYLLYQIACGEHLESSPAYNSHVRLRWLLGDLDRLYLVIRSKQFTLWQKMSELVKFAAIFGRGLHYEVNRLGDMRPFVAELRQYWSNLRS